MCWSVWADLMVIFSFNSRRKAAWSVFASSRAALISVFEFFS